MANVTDKTFYFVNRLATSYIPSSYVCWQYLNHVKNCFVLYMEVVDFGVFFFFIYLPLFYVSSVILWRILCFFLEILWRILCFSVDPMKNFMFFCRSYKEFIFFRRSYENFYVLSEILCRILCFDIFFKKWICLFDVWVNTGAFYTDIVSTDT
jgi:hypothetical protein